MGNKIHKNNQNVFEYEDFGTPTMYLWAVLSVLLMLAALVAFVGLITGGIILTMEAVQ